VERLLEAPREGGSGATLEVLKRAVTYRTAIGCRYTSMACEREEERVIEPYGLFLCWGRWYCVGRARDRDAMRVFRVDRMEGAVLMKGKAARFSIPAGFSIHAYADRAPWELSGSEPATVRVRFGFPESRWVQAQRLGTVIEPVLDDGGAILDFQVRDLNPFLRWLLTFRRQAEVITPETVGAQLETLRARVVRLYAGTGS
jgi:predicted DNA-binding transcriptional regulator YafY